MPKQLKEIKSFNLGTILNLSEKDIPQEAAAFSLNVDPLSENGILNSIKSDRLYFVSNSGKESYVESPISWNFENDNPDSDRTDKVIISDISVFDSKASSYIGFIGTKGVKERCIASNVFPHFTRIIGYGNPGTLTTTSITIDEGSAIEASPSSRTFNVNGTVGTLANIEDKLLNKEVYFSDGKYIGYCTSVTRVNDTDGTVVFSGGTKRDSINTAALHTKGSAIKFIPSSNIEIYDTEFTVLTDTIAITGTGHAGNLTITDETFTSGTATIQVDTNDPSTLADKTIIITSPDGKTITYKIKNSSGTTGTLDGTTVQIFCPTATSHDTDDEIAEEIKLGIENANGHDGRISVARNTNTLTLTFEQQPINTYLREGTYIALADLALTSGDVSGAEIIKVVNINSDNSTIQVERGCFGTAPVKYLTSKQYFIYGQMHTIDNLQINHNKGYCKVSSWSDYSGNHIGGNASFLRYCNTNARKDTLGGKIITSDSNHSVTFSDNDDGTGNFRIAAVGANDLPCKEGDYVTFYFSSNTGLNNGMSRKLLKKYTVDSNILHLVLDSPVIKGEDESTDDVFLEMNIIKNHTFHHTGTTFDSSGSADEVVSATTVWRACDWKHYSYSESGANILSNLVERTGRTWASGGSSTAIDSDKVARVASGGYWETSHGYLNDDGLDGKDNAEEFYPFSANDAYMKLISQYTSAFLSLSEATLASSDDIVLKTSSDAAQFVAANDIIRLTNGSSAVEYMLVKSVEGKNITVERGYFNTTPVVHAAAIVVHKSYNHGIEQEIDKNRMKSNQGYRLSFYAKSNSDSAVSQGALSIEFNGGFINSDGIWTESSRDLKNGYGSDINDIMQEHKWIKFSELNKPNNDSATTYTLDDIWRKFDFTFYTSKEPLSTNVKLRIISQGKDTTEVHIDLVDLSENTLLYNIDNSSLLKTNSYIDNSGIKDLVSYDSKESALKIIKGIYNNEHIVSNIQTEFFKSENAASSIESSNKDVSIVPKNREVHIGFGSKDNDTSPQWLGYVNHKVFGQDYSNELYQDEDTVHTYDSEGSGGLSKVCLAGEHEKLIAYWNNSGSAITDNSVGTNDLPDNSLRIHHTDHNMNLGDNIVVREWMDSDNSWDGNGVWIVTDAGDDNYFDCKRYNTTDADPAEEGVMATSSTSYSAPNATVDCDAAHNLTTGDSVLIYGGTNDTDINATHTITVTDSDTYTINNTDLSSLGNDTGVVTVKQFRISYRPYFYYGIKDGDNSIYRIWPDTQIEATTDTVGSLSATYTKGKIERSLPIFGGVTSIATCYNKKSDGTGGGRVYVLSNSSNEVYSYNVELAYNKWTTTDLTQIANMDLAFKSFKWSNDNVNGNINGNTEVFGGLASESSPTIEYAGKLSDIIETKGPNESYDIDATANTSFNPEHFDTRLWVQSSHIGEDGFTEGNRFLFCARTEDTNTDGPDVLYCADRTPPTTMVIGQYTRADTGGGIFFSAGPGVNKSGDFAGDYDQGYTHLPNWENIREYGYFYHYFDDDDYKRKNSRMSVYRTFSGESNSTNGHFTPISHSKPYINYGYNVGFFGKDGVPSIKVAKYGLFQMSDNDGDGVIDGTGLVIASNKSIIVDSSTTKNNRNGPYGRLHQRVCSHAVGLIGETGTQWQSHWGRQHGVMDVDNEDYYVTRYGNGPHEDAPEMIKANKCIFISSDTHYGDDQPVESYSCDVSAAYTSADSSTDKETILTVDTDTTTGGIDGLEVGDTVYIDGITTPQAAVITYVDRNNNTFRVAINPSSFTLGAGTWTVYPHAINKTIFDELGGVVGREIMFHYAYDEEEPDNGDIFTKGKTGDGSASGNFTKTYFTPPSYWGGPKTGSRTDVNPGYVFPIEKLSFRSGVMMRPFDMEDEDFNDLMLGNGIHVDMPTWPNPVYHVANSTNIHYDVGNSSPNNSFASKLFITCPIFGVSEQRSKVYMCDLNFLYPNQAQQQPLDSFAGHTNTNSWNNGVSWDVCLSGALTGGGYDTTNANTDLEGNNADQPTVTFDPAYLEGGNSDLFGASSTHHYRSVNNSLYGLCLSVMDGTTGTIQTRYIIGSKTSGTAATDTMVVKVHAPFGHPPTANDKFWIWKHSLVCTAPIRMMKTTTLRNNLGDALKGDPIFGGSIYKQTGSIDDLDSSGTTATATTSTSHNLTSGDKVEIYDASDANYIGIYSVTVTGPKTFEFTTSGSNLTDDSDAKWKLIDDSESSVANPLTVPVSRPIISTHFGGFDMRKLRSYTVDSVSSVEASEQILHISDPATHLLSTGDTITYDAGGGNELDGTYIIDRTDDDQVEITTKETATDAGTITTNQWEMLVAATAGASEIGELRSGFTQWDKGDIAGNIQRYDSTENSDRFINFGESSVTIEPTSLANQDGDFFLKNNSYYYKVSFIYDGYQEGPLSSSHWTHYDTSSRSKLAITIKVKKYSRRLTHVCVYRKDNVNDFYKLVKEIPTETSWNKVEGDYIYTFGDEGQLGATFESRTGMTETIDTIKIKYGLSVDIDGYLFVGDCSHTRIDNASNLIFRSKPGMFSVFDYISDFVTLKSKPTAMANFLGRLYAFDSNNIYRINPQNLVIEDTYEGIGCTGKNGVVVTEYGMFFADRNGAYMHDGQTPTKISIPIQKGGDTEEVFSGTDNIKDVSWDNAVTKSRNFSPYVMYDPNSSSVLFNVEYIDRDDVATEGLVLTKRRQYIWAFSISQKRWDLWELSDNSEIGSPFLGEKGEIYYPIDNGVYEFKGGSSKRDYTWISKKLTMGEDSITKVYTKIKLNGATANVNLEGSYIDSSDRLIIKTSNGDISTSDITYSSPSSGFSEYKISGRNKKGRWIQFKAENMTEPIDSFGIIFRRKSTK